MGKAVPAIGWPEVEGAPLAAVNSRIARGLELLRRRLDLQRAALNGWGEGSPQPTLTCSGVVSAWKSGTART